MNRQNQNQNGYNIGPGFMRSQRTSRRRQKGMTAIGMAIILALVAFFALLGIRLFPLYMENFNVNSHLKRIAKESETKTSTDTEILKTLDKRFQIDDVKNTSSEDVIIERQGNAMTISIDYEVRTPAIGNVDMVVSFKEEVVVN